MRVAVIGGTGHIGTYLVPQHISHSPSASIDRARCLLGFEPRYNSLEAVHEALAWMIAAGELDLAGASLAPIAESPASRACSPLGEEPAPGAGGAGPRTGQERP